MAVAQHEPGWLDPGANDRLHRSMRARPRGAAAPLPVVHDRQAAVDFVPAQRAAGKERLNSNDLTERAMVMDRIGYAESSGSRNATAESACMAERSHRPGDLPPNRVPVFRGPVFAGFIDRPDAPGGTATGAAGDDVTRLAGNMVEAETRTHCGIAGLRAENGIVRLAGEIDDPHELLALRKIAASLPGTMLVIDNLWVACE